MLSRRGIFQLSQRDITEMERLHKFVRDAAEVLKQYPMPDIFFGRKTQEPFPREKRLKEIVGD